MGKFANMYDIAKTCLDGLDHISSNDRELIEYRIRNALSHAFTRGKQRKIDQAAEKQSLTKNQEAYILAVDTLGGATTRELHDFVHGVNDMWTNKTVVVMDRLTEMKLTTRSQVPAESGGKPSNYYTLTTAGRLERDLIHAKTPPDAF